MPARRAVLAPPDVEIGLDEAWSGCKVDENIDCLWSDAHALDKGTQ